MSIKFTKLLQEANKRQQKKNNKKEEENKSKYTQKEIVNLMKKYRLMLGQGSIVPNNDDKSDFLVILNIVKDLNNKKLNKSEYDDNNNNFRELSNLFKQILTRLGVKDVSTSMLFDNSENGIKDIYFVQVIYRLIDKMINEDFKKEQIEYLITFQEFIQILKGGNFIGKVATYFTNKIKEAKFSEDKEKNEKMKIDFVEKIFGIRFSSVDKINENFLKSLMLQTSGDKSGAIDRKLRLNLRSPGQ